MNTLARLTFKAIAKAALKAGLVALAAEAGTRIARRLVPQQKPTPTRTTKRKTR